MGEKKPLVVKPEMEVNPGKYFHWWWWFDPVPDDWWVHLKEEQKVLVMKEQLKMAQVKIRAQMTVEKAQLESLAAMEKVMG